MARITAIREHLLRDSARNARKLATRNIIAVSKFENATHEACMRTMRPLLACSVGASRLPLAPAAT